MAEILATWLNEEVGLSQQVTNFEDDFASGYLLGELLYKFNQQADFEQFSKKDAISHRLQNFEKLEPTLRNLKIKFDSKMVDKIMKKERGISLRLLYQLKMVLEKVYPPTDIAVLTKTGQFGDNQPAQKIAMQKEKYDNVQHAFFKTRINALNKPQKVLNMEAHVKKFEDEKERQAQDAIQYESKKKEMQAARQQEMRRIQINKLQRNAGFMEEWHQKGVEDWKMNQKRKKDRESKQLEFDYQQAEKYNSVAIQKLEDANNEVTDGIANFEETLRSQGINPRVQKDVATKAVTDSFNKSKVEGTKSPLRSQTRASMHAKTTAKGAFTLTSTGLKQRTKKTLTDESRKQREKRRRRLIGQQEKLMTELELKNREALVLDLMKRQSNQEKELDYEIWRTNQCKEVIVKNRHLREEQYKKRKELDKQMAIEKEKEMLKTMQAQTYRLVNERSKRMEEMGEYEEMRKNHDHTALSKSLMNKIFDIADEAYKHQQRNDSQEIDSRNWHEWMQLFKNDMPIQGVNENLSELVTQETGGEGIQEKLGQIDASNKQLDDLELVDYLKNLGQWSASLVSENKPKLDEIMNPSVEADPKAKGKAPAKGAAGNPTEGFEEGDLEVSDVPDNNFLLGDALEQIIKINYESRSKTKTPKTPNYLPLKLCIVGYPFSGKKTQAEMIKAKYGVDIYQMGTLVQEAIDYAESNPKPLHKDATPKEELQKPSAPSLGDGISGVLSTHLKKSDTKETVEEDSEVSEDAEGEYNAEEDFRQVGIKVRDLLLDGEEISDDLYVQLFVSKLRMAYQYKDTKEKQKELKAQAQRKMKIMQRLGEIEKELQEEGIKAKQVKVLKAEEQSLKDEREGMVGESQAGWVLVDFPTSYAQAKLLEEALSGYKPEQELDPIQREIEMEEAFMLVQPQAKEQPPRCMIPSGLDAIMWFDCKQDEVQRRADGRRVDRDGDPETRTIFNVTTLVPPVDQAPLCERLENVWEEHDHSSTIVDKICSFDQQSRSLQRWLDRFGDEDRQRPLMHIIDASQDPKRVSQAVRDVIDQVKHDKDAQRTFLVELMAFKLKQMFEAKMKALLGASLQTEEVAEEEAAANGEEQNELVTGAASVNDKSGTLSANPNKTPAGDASESNPQNTRQQQESVVSKEPTKSRLSTMNRSDSKGSIGGAAALPERDNIDNDFKPVIIKLWQDAAKNYKEQMKQIFRNIRMQREQNDKRNSIIARDFLGFLHTNDGKQAILDEFVKSFNDFSDEYPDLREDDQTKEELHQRTDVVSDELWEIVEERKEKSIEFRKQIMEAGHVEFNLALITQNAQQLMQSEVDLFKTEIQVIQDYYHAVEEKLIPEAPPAQTVEIGFDGEEAPPIENIGENNDPTKLENYTYPRLDRLLALALKQQVVQDITQSNAVADAKGAKKGGKEAKKGGTIAEEDKQVEESVYVKEMRDAIKVQKSILRYRLVQIRNWTLDQLKKKRQAAIDLYKKLEDWVFVAHKAEMDAIEEMCMVVKQNIEQETKIQEELRISFMDFSIDQGVLNYINPPPPKHPALEEHRIDRFSIPQLEGMLEEYLTLAKYNYTGDQIRISVGAQQLFASIHLSAGFISARSGLPEAWNTMNMYQVQSLLRNLDPMSSGFFNWRQLYTYVVLLKSKPPSAEDIELIMKLADEDGYIYLEPFKNTVFWFDSTESSKDPAYTHPFERKRMVKELLFRTNSVTVEGKSAPVIRAQQLCDYLALPAKKKVKDFYEFLFAPVQTFQQ